MSQGAKVWIDHWQQGQKSPKCDHVAEEVPLEILIDHCDGRQWQRQNIAVTMRTPGNEAHLGLGFLFTEAIIKQYQDVEYIDTRVETNRQRIIFRLKDEVRVDLQKLSRNLYISSSCGVCSKVSLDLVQQACPNKPLMQGILQPEILLKMPDTLRQAQETFGWTGGLHASGIFRLDGTLDILCEDVGRHNALDKAIGSAMMDEILPLHEYVLVLSGRASFELLQKAAMAGLACVVALGAPSSLAVELAKSMDMTLIGFLKQDSFNIYAGAHRIA